jgi:hypothetical protein
LRSTCNQPFPFGLPAWKPAEGPSRIPGWPPSQSRELDNDVSRQVSSLNSLTTNSIVPELIRCAHVRSFHPDSNHHCLTQPSRWCVCLPGDQFKLKEIEEQRCKSGWITTSTNLRAALCKDSQKGSSLDKMNFKSPARMSGVRIALRLYLLQKRDGASTIGAVIQSQSE